MKSNLESNGDIIIYQSEDGVTKINVNLQDETVWLSIDQMSELFQRDKSTISRHIRNVFAEGELQHDSVVANFATTASDGKVYKVDYYNLDVIISVGYRVKSIRGTQFRIWATQRLKEYMIKGFTMDDERLKGNAGGNYWRELIDRIRDIRASEKVVFRQVLDLYATSIDFQPHGRAASLNSIVNTFYVSVQVPELVEGTTTSPGASTGSATVNNVRCLLSAEGPVSVNKNIEMLY